MLGDLEVVLGDAVISDVCCCVLVWFFFSGSAEEVLAPSL